LLDVVWEEETFWTSKSWAIDLDNLLIGKCVIFGKLLAVVGLSLISGEVE